MDKFWRGSIKYLLFSIVWIVMSFLNKGLLVQFDVVNSTIWLVAYWLRRDLGDK